MNEILRQWPTVYLKKQMFVYAAETRDDLMTSCEALATPRGGQNPRLETSA